MREATSSRIEHVAEGRQVRLTESKSAFCTQDMLHRLPVASARKLTEDTSSRTSGDTAVTLG